MWYDCRLWTLGRLGLRRSHTTTRNLILRGSTGKLRERGTAVAWDPWKEVDTLLRSWNCQWRGVSLTVAWDPSQDADALLGVGVAGDPSRGVDTTRGTVRIHGMVRTYSCEQEGSRSTKGGGHRRRTSAWTRTGTVEW